MSENESKRASIMVQLILIWEVIFGCIGPLLSAFNGYHPKKWAFGIAVALVVGVPLIIGHIIADGKKDEAIMDTADGFGAAGFWISCIIVAFFR